MDTPAAHWSQVTDFNWLIKLLVNLDYWLILGYGKTILAEFDFCGNPLETFPVDQGEQRRTMYHLKKDLMPAFYWQGILKYLIKIFDACIFSIILKIYFRGIWNGPEFYRKLMHPGKYWEIIFIN